MTKTAPFSGEESAAAGSVLRHPPDLEGSLHRVPLLSPISAAFLPAFYRCTWPHQMSHNKVLAQSVVGSGFHLEWPLISMESSLSYRRVFSQWAIVTPLGSTLTISHPHPPSARCFMSDTVVRHQPATL